jgi:hypothetical protein
VRAPWTAPCTRCTCPRWTALSKRRGTRSRPHIADRTAEIACKQGWRRTRRSAAARGRSLPALALDGVSGRHLNHEQVQNDAGALARVTGGSTGAIVPHRWPAPEGGGAAAPASLRVRCCARREEKLGGRYCSPRTEEDGGLTGGEEAAVKGLDDGGGSGGAPVSLGRDCHGLRGRKPATARACQAPGDPKNQRKRARGPILHRRRRIDGGSGNPRRRRGEINARARVLGCCRGKGRHRGSCASLNRSKGRKARLVGVGTAGGLPLMAAAITARCKERGNGPN